MRSRVLLFPALFFVVSSVIAQDASIDERLSDLEHRTTMFVSGKNNLIGGFAKLPENLQMTACKAYPIDSDEKAISLFKNKIAALESPDLDQHQIARLDAQRVIVSTLVPGIDCSKLQ
jgi:hypothetical protein